MPKKWFNIPILRGRVWLDKPFRKKKMSAVAVLWEAYIYVQTNKYTKRPTTIELLLAPKSMV